MDSIRGAATANPLSWLENRYGATLFAVGTAFALAALPAPGAAWTWQTAGTGGMILWPLFGATNQLLGGLAFMVLAFWLWRRKLPVLFAAVPMVFMLIMPLWAMLHQMFITAVGAEQSWLERGDWVLMAVGVATVALEVWMIVEALLLWPRVRGVLEKPLPPLAPAGG